MLEILNLESLEVRARERLDPMLFDYIAGGAGDEWTLHENRAAWSRLQLLPRMLRGDSPYGDEPGLTGAGRRANVLWHYEDAGSVQVGRQEGANHLGVLLDSLHLL